MKNLRVLHGIGIGVVFLGGACSLRDGDSSEPIGQSSAAITVATNYPAVLDNMHEVEVVKATFPGSYQEHWVAAFNNCSETTPAVGNIQCDLLGEVGSSSSADLTGSSWTPNIPAPHTEETMWVPPGKPTGGGNFKGWRGDPSIATIGNPPDGTHVIMTNVVVGGKPKPSDIATLLSSDGGQTWGSPQYISQPLGGADTDQPQIVTNVSPPYSTFAAWTSSATSIPALGWFTSINNLTFAPGSSSSAPTTWTGSAKQIFVNNNGYVRAKIAVGSIPWTGTGCSGPPHEVVYFVWSDNIYGRVCNAPGSVTWKMAIFDNTANAWAPTLYYIATDSHWPFCVSNNVFNNSNAYLATDGSTVAIAHNTHSALGTRIEVDSWTTVCNNNQLTASPVGFARSPDPCYIAGLPAWCPPGHTGGNGSDGGNVINDQWGARVAFQYNGSVPYMLVTWYDTSGDPTNTMVKINGAINTSGLAGNPFYSGTTPTIYQVSQASGSPPGQAVPWSDSPVGYWWDYQGIGVDTTNHTFLAAWGGDARLVNATANGPAGIWTAVVSTP